MRRKISRDSIKRGFKGKENIQGVTAVGKTNWKHFFLLWKRLALCWKKHRNENKEPFVFKLCQKHFHWFWQLFEEKVLTNPMLSLMKREERAKESRGAGVQQSHCWGGHSRDTHQEKRGQWYLWPTVWFPPRFFYLELILNPLFFAFS